MADDGVSDYESDIDSDVAVSDSDSDQDVEDGAPVNRGPWFNIVDPANFFLEDPSFVEETGPVNFGANTSILDYYLKFLEVVDASIVDLLVRETNRYAEQSIAAKTRPPRVLPRYARCRNWTPVSRQEMLAFIGLVLTMGVVKKPSYESYWENNVRTWSMKTPSFSQVMSRNRFQAILQFLHCNDNSTAIPNDQPGYDPLHKISPVINILNEAFERNYRLHQNVCVDERMVGFKGRHQLKQYLSNKKTHKWGIKLWVQADSTTGYTHHISVYKGRRNEHRSPNGQGYQVVMDLMIPHLNKDHHVTIDSFFTSPKLVHDLKDNGTFCTGTVIKSRKGMPQSFRNARLPKAEMIVKSQGPVMAVLWSDRRLVTVLTSTVKLTLKAVMEDRMFGALEIDIEVPEHLKSKFAEMPPIFKNVEISRNDIGEHMKTYAEEREIMNQPRKSLIGSMFGQKILIITPLLKWYIQHGLKVSKIYQVVEYTPASCFKMFGEHVSDARRAGDVDPNKKIVAETEKLKGCASYGKTGTNKEKYRDMFYCQARDVSRYLVDPSFRRCNQLDDNTFELELNKKSISLDLPNQIAYFVYQYAKLKMLQFYYDLIDAFVDRKDFQYCSMDTDSAYMALSAETLEDVIKPHLYQTYLKEKHQWFPRDDTPANAAYDKGTPGLFKEEYSGDGIVALCSKTYYCFGKEDKYSCKGINKRTNPINKDTYMDVLLTKKSASGTNRGFRLVDNHMYTYFQERAGFSYFYPKRIVLQDGISTAPLDL